MEVPIEARNNRNDSDGHGLDLSFTTDLRLRVVISSKSVQRKDIKDFMAPVLELELESVSELKNYRCRSRDDKFCQVAKNSLKSTFARRLANFGQNSSFFDQPSAYRLVEELISFVNHNSHSHSWSSLIDFDEVNGNLQVFLNCKN